MSQYSPLNLLFRAGLLCVTLSFFAYHAEAQDPSRVFSPVMPDSLLLSSLYNRYQQEYNRESDELPVHYKKDYQDCYRERWKNIQEKFTKKEIYTAAGAQAYLDGMVARIVAANPLLRGHSLHCYFSRSYIPNASYIGEG